MGEHSVHLAFIEGLPAHAANQIWAAAGIEERPIAEIVNMARAMLQDFNPPMAAAAFRVGRRWRGRGGAQHCAAGVGCWHCGGPHMQRDCKAFARLQREDSPPENEEGPLSASASGPQ